MQSLPSEKVALAAIRDPATQANTQGVTNGIDMSKFHQALFILALGNMANETIDFRLESSATSGGTYDAITGKAATQLAAHADNNDNKQIVIGIRAEQVPAGHRFVRGRAITGGATGGPACIIGLGLQPRYAPGSDDGLASVVQIVQ